MNLETRAMAGFFRRQYHPVLLGFLKPYLKMKSTMKMFSMAFVVLVEIVNTYYS